MNNRSAVVIALPTPDATPNELIEAGVRDANRAHQLCRERFIEHVRETAAHVHGVWQRCERHGISFRSLFDQGSPVQFEFSRTMGQRFLAIAQNPALAGGPHAGQSLPHDITTLAQLALIPAPRLQKLIEKGEVKQDMKRSEVAVLIAEARSSKPKARKAKTEHRNNDFDTAYETLRALLRKLPPKRRREVLADLIRDCEVPEILK